MFKLTLHGRLNTLNEVVLNSTNGISLALSWDSSFGKRADCR